MSAPHTCDCPRCQERYVLILRLLNTIQFYCGWIANLRETLQQAPPVGHGRQYQYWHEVYRAEVLKGDMERPLVDCPTCRHQTRALMVHPVAREDGTHARWCSACILLSGHVATAPWAGLLARVR